MGKYFILLGILLVFFIVSFSFKFFRDEAVSDVLQTPTVADVVVQNPLISKNAASHERIVVAENFEKQEQQKELKQTEEIKYKNLIKELEKSAIEIALVGIDPNKTTNQLLDLIKDARLDPLSVKGSGMGVEYTFIGLPQKIHATMMLRPKHRAIDLFVNIPAEESQWLNGLPRNWMRYSLSIFFNEDGNFERYSIIGGFYIDEYEASEQGLNYRNPDAPIGRSYDAYLNDGGFSIQSFYGPGQHDETEETASSIIGSLYFSADLLKRVEDVLVKFAKSVKPKEY